MMDNELGQLIRDYFSDPDKHRRLKKGEVLIKQGMFNDTLYLVLSGKLTGVVKNPDDSEYILFSATSGMFVGVYSFFSKTFVGGSTVTADENSEVAFIDRAVQESPAISRDQFNVRFMPIVIQEILSRQERLQKVSQEKEQALKKLIHTQQMASLGQMAAGIAHELNNAIAVIERNTDWLWEKVSCFFKDRFPEEYRFIELGQEQGRFLASRDARRRAKALQERITLPWDVAQKIAQSGIPFEDIEEYLKGSVDRARMVADNWEMGATFHDIMIATRQTVHVVKSVKALGATQPERTRDTDVNESIRESLALLRHLLRNIKVQLHLGEIPLMVANKGELVQVWTNLIRNACESMETMKDPEPELVIKSSMDLENIRVDIQDNGPGIETDILPKIFQPNMTTKVDGLSFGLGLGLAIVERLVDSYNGTVSVESVPGMTVFSVVFPVITFKS
jgi:signal transduction histidine kinase